MQYRTIRLAPGSQSGEDAAGFDPQVVLSPEEIRVLGSLFEKENTTPDYYPLSLNALVAACNQKSSRDPVVSYTEDTVMTALDGLRQKGLARVITSAEGGRVPRYRHLFAEAFSLSQPEATALCVLMLRGPQTVGEIRGRTNRIYDFASLAEVQETLDGLTQRIPRPLVAQLARQAGTKEPRYAHLLGGEPVEGEPAGASGPAIEQAAPAASETLRRLEQLEAEVESLRAEVGELRQALEVFRKQFE
jgi:uncharacterized protein YceH (UPF0502 family)